jgi:hypothetical protein
MIQDITQDVRFSDIGNLPSNFIPYNNEYKALNIRQFLVAELKLLSRAAFTKNVAHTIKAIDQTIDVPVNKLSIGDFYFILMWHKLHSFPKTPLSVSWDCRSKVLVDADGRISKEGTHEVVCDHPNAQLIHQSDIDILDLDEFTGFNSPELDFPRVALLPELLELSTNPDYAFLINSVQWIKAGDTLVEKFAYLEAQNDIGLYEEAENANRTVIHGVNEIITLKCTRCGSNHKKKLVVDPVNFFRACL